MKPDSRRLLVQVTFGLLAAAVVVGDSAADDPFASGLVASYELPFFRHENGMDGELLFPEMTGQGAGLIDYDGDGDLDIYLVQGGTLTGTDATADSARPGDVLLRNDGTAQGPTWIDVTERSRLNATGYGMAVATGDLDGDGAVDLFLANYGRNQLWRNRGDGTFENISSALQELGPSWSTSGAIFDYDGDGWDDLYIANYVDYSVSEAPACYAASSMRDYCGPSDFAAQPDRLLTNLGDGRFEDASLSSGIGRVAGPALGLGLLDADGDGRLELYVANDGKPNYLWSPRSAATGGWSDEALLAGLAVNRRGEPEASMGVAVGDYDRDGDEDFLVTHLDGETNTLYVNQGSGLFDDRTTESGLAGSGLGATGFGVSWVDLDHDGWLDLAIANGAVRIEPTLAAAGVAHPLGQANLLFANRAGQFEQVEAPAAWTALEASRGLVSGDLDNDGDRDLLVTTNAGSARVFEVAAATEDNWIGVSFARSSGQLVRRFGADGRVDSARATTIGSYASAADPRIVFGGGCKADWAIIDRPEGTLRLAKLPTGRYLRFR